MQPRLLSNLVLILLLASCAGAAHAAVVGNAGYTNAFTSAAPAASDWSTLAVGTGSGTITDAAGLNAAVQTTDAGSVTTVLANGGVGTPTANGNALWGSDGFLQTRPTTVAYTLLMATLVNSTATNATGLRISYDFTATAQINEVVFGHLVFYSLTGAANSWTNLASFQSTNSATLITNVTLPTPWASGGTLYLLFADDNGVNTPDTANQIDNFFIGITGGTLAATTVNLTAPADGQSFNTGLDITLNANASGPVTNVAFYHDSVLIGNDPTATYSAVYSNATIGAHVLTAVAKNSSGVSVTSAAVNITVTIPLTNNSFSSIYGVKTVFLILMENHNWSTIKGSPNCAYINNTLLPMASYATEYFTPTNLHPSEPNYIWLEGGTNFGILDDSSTNRINSTNHLVTQLNNAGISWKSYQEDIDGSYPPGTNILNYAVKHNPQMLFQDVAFNTNYCLAHIRPFTELAADLTNNNVGRYNFITPNLTNDMHDTTPGSTSTRIQGDHWLSNTIPMILASAAYTNGGAIFITWDEGSLGGAIEDDGPLGMIVLSPRAKGGGYTNKIYYTHSSTLRTMQDIFGVRPYLGDTARVNDLSDLFRTVQIKSPATITDRQFRFSVTNLYSGKTNLFQYSTNLSATNWTTILMNVVTTNYYNYLDTTASNSPHRFYRVIQLP